MKLGRILLIILFKKPKKIKYGDPYDPSNDLGSLIDSDSAKIIKSRVDDALNKGAKLLYGNIVDGALYSPTIIDHVKHDGHWSLKKLLVQLHQ